MRQLIRTDGTKQDLAAPITIRQALQHIQADSIDTVILRHMGEPMHVMLVDDTGMLDNRPVNPEATRLYHLNCHPGTVHQIHGDVVIVPDNDFA